MNATEVRNVVKNWLADRITDVDLGLPEYDDRKGIWRVALVTQHNGMEPVGEVQVLNGEVIFSSNLELVTKRIKRVEHKPKRESRNKPISFRPLPSRLILGDAAEVLADYPPDSIQLVFTSPPYFNAKPEAHESEGYESYLNLLRDVFQKCHTVLSEGRFMVVNTSPVLIRRPHRGASSRRIPITFDIHAILDEIGFEFIDDIIWQKPEGAGWHLGRGRRFAADRQPLQYKAVTVTENVIVYRKRTDKLIDWNLKNHPDAAAIEASLIDDDYEKTNIWRIHPAHHKEHPAVFPDALADRVIRYYSFVGDMVLDPFAGTGTTGRVAGLLDRRFMMIEKSPVYFNTQLKDLDLLWHRPQVCDYEYFGSTI